MHIAPESVVRLRYRITDAQGEVVDAGDQPLTYLHGGHGEFFASIEAQLEGRSEGYEQTYHLEPEDAFGDYDAELVRLVARAELPEPLEIGMQFEGLPVDDPMGDNTMGDNPIGDDADTHVYTVTDIAGDSVVLDGNHPLAGLALRVWVKVEHVRPASEEELAHGHAAGEFGVTVVSPRGDTSLH